MTHTPNLSLGRRFEERVDPSLLPGLDALRQGDVAPSLDPEILARIRGIAVGTLAEPPANDGAVLPIGIGEIRDHFLRRENGDDLLVRTFHPEGPVTPLPAVLYIHGGGMIRGSVRREQAGAIRLAKVTGAVVASVEYRLAPEHPYPAAVTDCYQAFVWLYDNAAALQIDANRIVVCGGSAGGGLAAAISLMARDRGGPPICLQVLSSPMLDDRTATKDLPEFDGIPGWNVKMNRFGWDCLLPGYAGEPNIPVYAAPARASDLSGLPPTFLSLGQLEIFRDEGLSFAAALAASGVPVELHLYPGAYHGWEPLNPDAELSRLTAAARERAIRNAFVIS